jgi:hypothetical protein
MFYSLWVMGYFLLTTTPQKALSALSEILDRAPRTSSTMARNISPAKVRFRAPREGTKTVVKSKLAISGKACTMAYNVACKRYPNHRHI